MLKVGDPAPLFSTQDHIGRTVSLKDFLGRRVVMWFFPKADTPGCTKQGCGFRDASPEYVARKVEVLGVSVDSVGDNKAFAEKFKFPFRLLSDPERKICVAYQACDQPTAKSARRITYVIGADGKIERAIETADPGAQAKELLGTM